MRNTLADKPPAQIGVMAFVLVVLIIGLSLKAGTVVDAISGNQSTAYFANAGGLHSGDKVRVSGVRVGNVKSVELDGTSVRVVFSSDRSFGNLTKARIKTETLLGSKYLELEPAGTGKSGKISLDRTSTPYDLTTALSDLTRTTEEIDAPQLAASLDSLSTAFAKTPPKIRAVLDGTRRLAETIGKRDQQLTELFKSAQGVSGVLAERNGDIIAVISQGNLLLGELQSRREVVARLFTGLNEVSLQMTGLARDNKSTLKPALQQLRQSLEVINANLDNLQKSLTGFSLFMRSLLEGIGSGPFFNAYIGGLAPVSMTPILGDLLAQTTGKATP